MICGRMKHNSIDIRATAALSANAAVAAARAIIAITSCFFIVSFLSKNQLRLFCKIGHGYSGVRHGAAA